MTFKGDLSLERSKISLKAMFRALQKEKKGIWVEFNSIAGNDEEDYEHGASAFL